MLPHTPSVSSFELPFYSRTLESSSVFAFDFFVPTLVVPCTTPPLPWVSYLLAFASFNKHLTVLEKSTNYYHVFYSFKKYAGLILHWLPFSCPPFSYHCIRCSFRSRCLYCSSMPIYAKCCGEILSRKFCILIYALFVHSEQKRKQSNISPPQLPIPDVPTQKYLPSDFKIGEYSS